MCSNSGSPFRSQLRQNPADWRVLAALPRLTPHVRRLVFEAHMAKDFIGYQALTDSALRGVVRDALRRIEKSGLIGAHHFYLTFKTHAEGVDIPDFLKEQYPDEMTIIIQHQYWALKVKEDYFEVTLTFKKLPAPLHIPFAPSPPFSIPACSSACNSAPRRKAQPSPPPGRWWCRPARPRRASSEAPEPVAPQARPPATRPARARW